MIRKTSSLAYFLAVLVLLTACNMPARRTNPPQVFPTVTPQAPIAEVQPDGSVVIPETGCTYNAVVELDISFVDYARVEPQIPIGAVWRLRNTGTCDWGEGAESVQFILVGGNIAAATNVVAVPQTAAGATVDLQVQLTSGTDVGTYYSIWQMQAPSGDVFGNQADIFVVIDNGRPPETTPRAPGQVPTIEPGPTLPPGQPTLVPTPTLTTGETAVAEEDFIAPHCEYKSTYVADVTIPDFTVLEPGESFVKTWRIRNSGTCNWYRDVRLVFAGQDRLGAPASVALPRDVVMGETVDISVTMTAPQTPGQYISIWQLQSPAQIGFGDQPYVQIVVGDEQAAEEYIASNSAYVSGVSARSREIFLRGQQLGNRANVFSKIGDSLTDESWFLYHFGEGLTNLQSYANLQPTVNFFLSETARTSNSFNNDSVAAAGGWNSFSLLDTANSRPYSFCGNMNPVECELEVSKPAVAIIMIGTNEAMANYQNGTYQANIRAVVQICIDRGVIPVLSTIPWNQFREPGLYNAAIISIARQYDIPVIDYGSAADRLPNRGISGDGVHPSVPPDRNTANFSEENLQYGYTVRNLVTLQMLDALRRQVLY